MEDPSKNIFFENNEKSKLVDEINELKADIAEIEELNLETRYPHLLDLRYDTGLPGEEYSAWQKLQGLRIKRKDLERLEKEFRGKK